MAGLVDVAYVEILPDLKKFDKQATKEIKASLEDAAKEADKAGKDIEESISDSFKGAGRQAKVTLDGIQHQINEVDGIIRVKVVVDGKEVERIIKRDVQGRFREENGRFVSVGELAGLGITEGIGGAVSAGTKKLGPSLLKSLSEGFSAATGPLLAVGITIGAQIASAVTPAVLALGASLPAAIGVAGAAIGTLILGFQGLDEAVKNFSDDEKFQEALKNLSPAAARFATELRSLVPIFKSIRNAAQEGLFKGFEGQITSLITTLQGPLRAGFGLVGDAIQGMVKELFGVLKTQNVIETLNFLFIIAADNIKAATPFMISFFKGIIDLAAVGLPFVDKLLFEFSKFIGLLGDKLSKAAASGALNDFFEKALDTLYQLGRIADNTFQILAALFGANVAAGEDWLDTIEKLTSEFADFLSHKESVEALSAAFTGLGFILSINFKLLILASQAGRKLGEAVAGIIQWTKGAIKAVGEFGTSVGQWFTSAWAAVKKFFSDIGTAISDFGSSIATWFSDAWASVTSAVSSAIDAVVNFFSALPGRVGKFLAAIPGAILGALQSALQVALKAIGVGVGLILFAVLELPKRIPGYLAQLWQVISTFFVNLWNSVYQTTVNAWNSLIAWFAALPARVVAAFTSLVGALQVFFVGLWQAVSTWTMSAWDSLVAWFSALPGRIVNAVTSLYGMLSAFFVGLWNDVRTWAINGWNSVIAWIAGVPGRIASLVSNFYNSGVSLIRGLINGIASGAGGVASSIGNSIYDSFRSGINWAINQINSGIASVDEFLPGSLPRIPPLATGGLVTGPMLAQIGERGDELVLPLSGQRGRKAMQMLQEGDQGPEAGVRRWSNEPTQIQVTLEIDTRGSKTDEALLKIFREAIRIRGGNVQKVLGRTAGGVA